MAGRRGAWCRGEGWARVGRAGLGVGGTVRAGEGPGRRNRICSLIWTRTGLPRRRAGANRSERAAARAILARPGPGSVRARADSTRPCSFTTSTTGTGPVAPRWRAQGGRTARGSPRRRGGTVFAGAGRSAPGRGAVCVPLGATRRGLCSGPGGAGCRVAEAEGFGLRGLGRGVAGRAPAFVPSNPRRAQAVSTASKVEVPVMMGRLSGTMTRLVLWEGLVPWRVPRTTPGGRSRVTRMIVTYALWVHARQ